MKKGVKIPELNQDIQTQANLTVLRKHDPRICGILAHASYAVVYYFSEAQNGWEKAPIEGSCFVVWTRNQTESGIDNNPSGKAQTRVGIFVLNRINLDNYVDFVFPNQEIDSGEQAFTLENDIIMYRSTTNMGRIVGLWIYGETDRLKIYDCLCGLTCNSTNTTSKDIEAKTDIQDSEEENREQCIYTAQEFFALVKTKIQNQQRNNADAAIQGRSKLEEEKREEKEKEKETEKEKEKGGGVEGEKGEVIEKTAQQLIGYLASKFKTKAAK